MALTRKLLTSMGIEGDKVDEIISAHAETVDALKEERDAARREAEANRESATKLEAAEKELGELKAEIERGTKDPYEQKYNDLKAEYDKYKADAAAKEADARKREAYRALLKEAGIAEKRLDTVMRCTDFSSMELAEDGKIKDADKASEKAKEEWADFIQTEGERGVNPPSPPSGGGKSPKEPSAAAQRIMRQREALYGKPKEE